MAMTGFSLEWSVRERMRELEERDRTLERCQALPTFTLASSSSSVITLE